jgi:hypothetical protein
MLPPKYLYHTYHLLPCCVTGGLGKSTLATQVFNNMSTLPLFSDSFMRKYVTLKIDLSHEDAVIQEVNDWLFEKHHPILLVLDNVQSQCQLYRLLSEAVLKQGSFVMVTSRIQCLNVDNIYNMTEMEHDEALQLFRYYSQGNADAGAPQSQQLQVW